MSFSPLILVINCGSSSLKFSILAVDNDRPVLSGIAERLGLDNAYISFKDSQDVKTGLALPQSSHKHALQLLIEQLDQRDITQHIVAVGHRVAHGGSKFKQSVMITPQVLDDIKSFSQLAPLHNPANAQGIEATLEVFPQLPQVAVFDTSYHQTLSAAAYTYAIPYEYQQDLQVRRYGFHGTSHRYVAESAVSLLGLDPNDHGILVAHLGNGSSVCAVNNGESVDTSMGMTPIEGLVMGTRGGDIDFGILTYLARCTGKSLDDLDEMMNKESGLLGISGVSSDCRTLQEERSKGHPRATLAIDVFVHRLARHLGGHMMSLSRLDAIVFTGGIGENSSLIRELTVKHLSVLGITLDADKNANTFGGKSGIISITKSPIIVVIPTNEEKMIALDVARLANIC
ncbi:propionate kinase [Budvicia aquatica]|uniref:Acetate kinase n=1 Tax=Budvicia aquatica TaxID=82979 RepID=A0A2C6DS00_9GAMM|nr:propionate kinase [Budvicia aquatica]PHI31102.1 propionate kinase [Budvicia aquatica]VFS51347.1 Propionate kinase [Budvicia aquatica]